MTTNSGQCVREAAGPPSQLQFLASSRYYHLDLTGRHLARWYALSENVQIHQRRLPATATDQIQMACEFSGLQAQGIQYLWGEGTRRAYWYSRDESTEKEKYEEI